LQPVVLRPNQLILVRAQFVRRFRQKPRGDDREMRDASDMEASLKDFLEPIRRANL
jgi:hypothetical protein